LVLPIRRLINLFVVQTKMFDFSDPNCCFRVAAVLTRFSHRPI